jgi:asparagine synthase (glutamine-hydrolysing)
MRSACGRYVLVFNGEIYNQHDLRSELEALGHRFRSSSDTEVLLELLARHGLGAIPRLRGMYAFCLYDQQEQSALLARDPYGIKPLYLHRAPGGELLFASELRALLATGLVPRRPNAAALAGFLQQGSVPAPATLVEGVQVLPPGHLGLWQDGRWQVQPHWQPSYAREQPLAYPELVAHTRAALQQSVRAHLLADVPVGLFLSGGMDSGALLALAGGDLTCLSIGFAEAAFNETPGAAALAARFGARHEILSLEAADAAQALPGFLAAVDQPSVDGFNTYCVAALAARRGLKVVLSGLGGDELFGGYPSFRKLPWALAAHHNFQGLAPAVAPWLARNGKGWALRLAEGLLQPPSAATGFGCLRGLFAPSEVRRLLGHWGLSPGGEVAISAGDLGDDRRFTTTADQIAWLESSVYMGQQLLPDSDTYAMAHGLELRLPLVDAQLFRSLAGQPASRRLAARKQLLRDAVPEVAAIVGRGPKQGFSFPFQRWFEADQAFGLALRPQLPPVPAGLDLQPWARRWGLMVLNDWLQRHLGVELG